QQQLVAAVGARVQGLGEHRARAGDDRRNALGHRDDDIDGERLEDLAGRLARHRASYLMTLDSARNSSVPARPRRSNTQTSVEVTIAPARSIKRRPVSRFASLRLHTASAHTWVAQPRATRSRALW